MARGQPLFLASTAGPALLALGFTAALAGTHAGLFRPYLGSLPPTWTVAALGVATTAALGWLRAAGALPAVSAARLGRGCGQATAIALAFGVLVVAVDVAARFPRDINAPFPPSMLFYPAIAFVAESVFHVLPLTLLLGAAWAVTGRRPGPPLVVGGLALLALVEPAFQTGLGLRRGPLSGLALFTAIHVLAINAAQLWLLRRYGFLPMIWLRWIYYLVWHVAWGHLRLQWLFA